jgi:adenylosuccinate lyase
VPNKEKLLDDLQRHPEVLAAGIQTILRKEGYEKPYELLKEATRGKKLSLDELRSFIASLKISGELKRKLLKLKPEGYLGLATELTDQAIKKCKQILATKF